MTTNDKALESLLDSIDKNVHVKSFIIRLVGTCDDTSHRIAYTKYKNSGILKVIDSHVPVSFRLENIDFSKTSVKRLVIENTKSFDNEIYGFLRDCLKSSEIHRGVCDGAGYIVSVKLSNGRTYAFDSELASVYVLVQEFYKYLSEYHELLYFAERD